MDWGHDDERLGLALPHVDDQWTLPLQSFSVDPVLHDVELAHADWCSIDLGPNHAPNFHTQ